MPSEYEDLRKSLETLRLKDGSFTFEPETSDALGFGFRCGFLGLLHNVHMEVIQQRLEREDDMDFVQTAPTVRYRVKRTNGEIKEVRSPSKLPDGSVIEEYLEPITYVNSVVAPAEYIGAVMKICTDRRGDLQAGVRRMNEAIEALVRRAPGGVPVDPRSLPHQDAGWRGRGR